MTKQFLRSAVPALFLTFMVLMSMPDGALAQSKAHIMDLVVETHDDGTKECVGDPNVLRVNAGDIIVFRARDVVVNHVRWHRPSQAQMSEKALSQQPDQEDGFAKGSAFSIMVNPDIQETSTFVLDVKCGEELDGPPVIIVDP